MKTDVDVNENVAYNSDFKVKRVYWGAIFAGAILMLITMMLLNLLGFGIGMGSINPSSEASPFEGLGTGALIWWIISNIIAIFAGGYVAGRMAGIPHKQSALLHGIVSWCIYSLITLWIYTTALGTIVSGVGSVVSGTFSGLNKVVNAAGSAGDSELLENLNLSEVKDEANKALSELGVRDTVNQLRNDLKITEGQIASILRKVYIEEGEINTQVSRGELVNAVVEETNLSRAQAENVATSIEQQANKISEEWKKVKEDVIKTGEDVASTASTAAIWAFVALLVGAITAAVGGMAGAPRYFLHEELFKREIH